VGRFTLTEDLQHWVNDGLMVVFFFVVGLEIKRELAVGELRGVRAAALPAIAALGGVLVPILLFLALASPPDRGGWGVPMATDIAFAVGVLALVGAGTSSGAKLFLLSVAIVDDILAIVVIALVYSGPLHAAWLLLALAAVGVVVVMRRFVTSTWAYVLPGFVLWVALFESGVHATLAGVVLGLLTPATPVGGRPVLEQLEHRLHPVSAYVVVPLFALANAGVYLRGGVLGDALGARLTWAVAVGLVVGKLVGIWGATTGALRARLGTLPAGTRRAELPPVAALGGIGFTVALFVADLAFPEPLRKSEAKVGIFVASIAAAALGALLLRLAVRRAGGRRSA
jgi:Na+:H+ antiporter, NhaA family